VSSEDIVQLHISQNMTTRLERITKALRRAVELCAGSKERF
jgi:hypothetical protein